jgi:hypothetical protein
MLAERPAGFLRFTVYFPDCLLDRGDRVLLLDLVGRRMSEPRNQAPDTGQNAFISPSTFPL